MTNKIPGADSFNCLSAVVTEKTIVHTQCNIHVVYVTVFVYVTLCVSPQLSVRTANRQLKLSGVLFVFEPQRHYYYCVVTELPERQVTGQSWGAFPVINFLYLSLRIYSSAIFSESVAIIYIRIGDVWRKLMLFSAIRAWRRRPVLTTVGAVMIVSFPWPCSSALFCRPDAEVGSLDDGPYIDLLNPWTGVLIV